MQNNNITIRQARLQGHEGLWQITIENGRFSRIEPQEAASLPQGEVLDAEGSLAIPPFVEPHIHLDTTQTAGEPSWNQSGTLFEGIERWAERKAMLTHEDVKARAMQTLKWQMANGIQYVRTHVDVSESYAHRAESHAGSEARGCAVGRPANCRLSARRYSVLSQR